jgi:hypothetical protein
LFRQIRQRDQHVDAVVLVLIHTKDAAAAHFHAGLPDIFERFKTVGKTARRGDARIKCSDVSML